MELNIMNNIDDEWDNFIANKYENEATDDENNMLHDEFNLNSNELNSDMETFKNCTVPSTETFNFVAASIWMVLLITYLFVISLPRARTNWSW